MLKTVIKSTIGSLVATAALNMAYSINNYAILVGLNIVVFIGLYIASDKDDKLSIEYKANLEEIKLISKDMKEMSREINEINMLISQEVIKTNEKLIVVDKSIVSVNESIKQTMEINENVGKSIEGNVNELSKMLNGSLLSIDNNAKNRFTNVVDGIGKINENINNNINSNLDRTYEIIKTNHKDIINTCTNIEDEIKGSITSRTLNIEKATDEIINSIEQSTKDQSNTYEEIINENIDKLVDEIDSTKSQVASMSKDIKRNKNDIIEAIEVNTDSNKEVITQYKEVQGAMLKELNIIADKNKHTTEVLMSNYKVLNAIMES